MSALLATSGTLAFLPSAFADDEADQAVYEAQSRVEETAQAYDQVIDQIDALEGQIADNEQRVADIESKIPAQREASNAATVALYKLSQEGCTLIDILLGCNSVTEFLQSLDYINRVQERNAAEATKLITMERDLKTAQDQMRADRSSLEAQRESAETALAEAQDARLAAQAAAEEKKRLEAEAAAANATKVEVPEDANTGSTVTESSETAEADAAATAEAAATTTDSVDWTSDKATFVSGWAARIDAYLAGSPMAGTGTTFAEAAWDYGVDPRWSPAISTIESSKGAACFLPYNAWGWGSSSWSSWEEAIVAHVKGLATGYGYTITEEYAQKYCPPNWQTWYTNVSAQMALI